MCACRRPVTYATICQALQPHGLIARGGFVPEPDDGLSRGAASVVMVGNAGSVFWQAFSSSGTTGTDAMNRWTRHLLDPIADRLGGATCYPFDGPPWWPFQRWARRAETVFESPIGVLIHPQHGLWHAYRGALVFDHSVSGMPERDHAPNPCDSCVEKPCLDTCPVHAFAVGTYDVPACARHLGSPQGSDCMDLGCRARRACPVGRHSVYRPDHARFHMEAFLRARPDR